MGRIAAGFLAGVLAVLAFHQPMGILLAKAGFLPAFSPYSMAATATAHPSVAAFFQSLGYAGWPVILNLCFWGGLWGLLYGLINGVVPGRSVIWKGLVFGFLIQVFNWTALAYIQELRGLPNAAYFSGLVPQRMAIGLVFQMTFGLSVAIFYRLLRRG